MIAFVAVSLAGACSRSGQGPPVPADAQTTADAVRWVRLRAGGGRRGAQTLWWSADWKDLPCIDECEHVYNGRRDTALYDRFRSNLLEMREGELRRVWVPGRRGRYLVYELRLAQAYDTLRVIFAPTGAFHELSMPNGWGGQVHGPWLRVR